MNEYSRPIYHTAKHFHIFVFQYFDKLGGLLSFVAAIVHVPPAQLYFEPVTPCYHETALCCLYQRAFLRTSMLTCHSGKNTGVLTIALYYSSVSATMSKHTLHQEAKQSIWNLTIIHITIHIGARPLV